MASRSAGGREQIKQGRGITRSRGHPAVHGIEVRAPPKRVHADQIGDVGGRPRVHEPAALDVACRDLATLDAPQELLAAQSSALRCLPRAE